MTFFLNLLFTLLFSYLIGFKYKHTKLTDCAFYICLFYIGLVWIIIAGGQDNVGTDYPAYLDIFSGDRVEHYKKTGEIVFYYLVIFLNFLGLKGQVIFYIFYSINFIFLIFILKRFKLRYSFLFFLLYITYCNIYNNQLNILRQVTAIHICTYAVILFYENKKKLFSILILIATGIHLSSIIFYGLFILKWINKLNKRHLKFILYFCFAASFILSTKVFSIFTQYLPPMYAVHLLGDSLERESMLTAITKYMYIPLFIWSTFLLKNNLTPKERSLYIIGYLGFCLRILLIKISIISRVSDCFIILTAFPLFFLLRYLKQRNKKILFYLIVVGLIAFYGLKTLLFPSAEYMYNSIYKI